MATDTQTLKDHCEKTRKAARAALDWIGSEEQNEQIVANRKTFQKPLQRFANEAAVLSRAAEKPMTIGLFGQSQAGKSYLAGGLSKKMDGPPLKIMFGAEERDFLAEINPVGGGKESTGIVTRFSVKPLQTPAGYPVSIQLLGEADLVKILGNAYFLESSEAFLKERGLSAERVEQALADARSRAAPTPLNGFRIEQVWDLQEYFSSQFFSRNSYEALQDFWDEAEELAPRLDVDGRAVLFAPLWGGFERLTRAYLSLVKALERLGFADHVYAKIDALIPRSTSIIEIERLKEVENDGGSQLELTTRSGATVTLPRGQATALAAELQLQIKEKSWDFFDHTDLLDFPGARNRDGLETDTYLETQPDAFFELFRRGKVAFLFDRYVAEQDLTSMVLVIKGGPQDITSLPRLVTGWIEKTHGKTPKDRTGRPTLLFMVLGWFNDELKSKPGEEEDWGQRFQNRLDTVYREFFAKSDEWPANWQNGQPFQNTYWLRDPEHSKETYTRDENGIETIKPEHHDRFAALREACLALPDVQRYFDDPAAAFDTAVAPNDGGVSRLAERLGPVSEPDMKARQVAARLTDIRKDMARLLTQFHISDDLGKRLEEREAAIFEVLGSVEDAAYHQSFGRALKALQISEGPLVDHLYHSDRKQGSDSPADAALAEKAPPPPRKSLFGNLRKSGDAETPPPSEKPVERHDRARMIGEDIVGAWLRIVSERIENPRVCEEVHFQSAHFKEVLTELAQAARRCGLAEAIARQIRTFSFNEAQDNVVQRNAVIGTRIVNAFVSTAGLSLLPRSEWEIPVDAEGTVGRVFAEPAFASARLTLSDQAVPTEEQTVMDWGLALLALARANARSLDGQDYDVERNAALGEILDSVSAAVE